MGDSPQVRALSEQTTVTHDVWLMESNNEQMIRAVYSGNFFPQFQVVALSEAAGAGVSIATLFSLSLSS